jgi:tetratricopeptide (TPR) repeat protein
MWIDPSQPEADQLAILQEIQSELRKVSSFITTSKIDTSYAAIFELIPKAYAGPTKEPPAWIKSPPEDKSNLYFIGIAESRSLNKAKEISYHDALYQGARYLSGRLERRQIDEAQPIDANSLSEYIIESAEIADTYTDYNREKKTFRYYTLLRLDRGHAELDMIFYSAEQKVDVPQQLMEVVKQHEPAHADDYRKRVNIYEMFLGAARETLSPEDYEKFLEARHIRKTGRDDEAIAPLTELIEKYPDFYFGWYNLALAYDAIDQPDKAEEAFLRAVDLEKQLPGRDATLYTAYGHFLFRLDRFEEAIGHLEEALRIDPDHANAMRTLNAARAKISD